MSIKNSTELKGLETRYKEIETKRNLLIKEIEEKQQQSTIMRKQLVILKGQIESVKQKSDGKIVVSEHSMLRYIERVLGIDLKTIEDKILSDEEKDTVKTLGNCTYPKDGFKIKIKDNTVVTVLTKEED